MWWCNPRVYSESSFKAWGNPNILLIIFCVLQHVFCVGQRQRWTVVGRGNQWKLFLFLAAVEVASCSWRTKTAKFAFAHNSYHDITIIVNTMMVNNFLLVHWTNILTPLTFWSIPFKACKFLFNVWFYSLTSDSCWYEFSILRTWSNRVGNRITNETGSTKVPSSDSLSLFPRIVARVDFLKMPLWSKVWPGCETWNVEIKLPLILSFAADSQK